MKHSILALFLIAVVHVFACGQSRPTAGRLMGGSGVPVINCNATATRADVFVRTDVSPRVLYICSATNTWTVVSGAGDVAGPASATDNAIPKFVGTGGKTIENTGVLISDTTNDLTVPGTVSTGDGTVAGEPRMFELSANGSNYISLLAPDSITNTLRLKFPNADPTVGQHLEFTAPSSNIATGSWVSSDQAVELVAVDFATATSTGDGKDYFVVPARLNGYDLVGVRADVFTAGTTGTLNVDLDKCSPIATGNKCSGTVVDLLSTNLTVDSSEDDSDTAAAPPVIDTSNDGVVTGDTIRVNIDSLHTTPASGLVVILTFRKP